MADSTAEAADVFSIRVPSNADLQEYAWSLSLEQLGCRVGGGHHSAMTGAPVMKPVQGQGRRLFIQVNFVCLRGCGVWWEKFFDQDYNLVDYRTHYEDSPGYLASGLGRINGSRRSVLRKVYMERVFGAETQGAAV